MTAYLFGSPFTVNPDAPTPPAFDADLLKAVFEAKTKVREEWIAKTMADRNCDRFHAAIDYDMNHSPKTTNAKQLREIGVFVPSTMWVKESTDQDIHRILWEIVYGLATLGIYLANTNSRTDRELLYHLCTAVLKDTISDIPPTPDMNEFIDLGGLFKLIDRDHLLPTPIRTADPLPDLSDLVELLNFPEDPANN